MKSHALSAGFIFMALMLTTYSVSSGYAATSVECPKSILEVVASVVYIEPKISAGKLDAKPLTVWHKKLSRQVGSGDCLLSGETLSLKDDNGNRKIRRVEVFYAGDSFPVTENTDPFTVPIVQPSYSALAKALVENVFGTFSARLPKVSARTTATWRGELQKTEAKMEGDLPLRPIEPLRRLPTQLVTHDTALIVGWHNGVSPYVCQGLSLSGEVLLQVIASQSDSCVIPLGAQQPARIVVRDSLDNQYGWNVDFVQSRDIPRPDWIVDTGRDLASGDRAAWAIWLWQNASDTWRLQAMGMLRQASMEIWVAGYVLRHILDEVPIKRGQVHDP